MDDDEVPGTEVEAVDEGEVDPDDVKVAVRRILVTDEARLMSVVSVGLIAVGAVFSLAWLFLAWRVERQTTSSVAFGGSGSGGEDADVVDRIITLVQISGLLIVPLLLVAGGCALRLYASRVFTAQET